MTIAKTQVKTAELLTNLVEISSVSGSESIAAEWLTSQMVRIGFDAAIDPAGNADELAAIAESAAMPVAGGESGYGSDFFARLIDAGTVSIIMPDVKFCGGVAEAATAGRAALDAGANVSLHSPSGPVSSLASAHVTAAMPGAMHLETAVHEATWRADLLSPPERIEDGRLRIPDGPGLGATLNVTTLLRRGGRRWEP